MDVRSIHPGREKGIGLRVDADLQHRDHPGLFCARNRRGEARRTVVLVVGNGWVCAERAGKMRVEAGVGRKQS